MASFNLRDQSYECVVLSCESFPRRSSHLQLPGHSAYHPCAARPVRHRHIHGSGRRARDYGDVCLSPTKQPVSPHSHLLLEERHSLLLGATAAQVRNSPCPLYLPLCASPLAMDVLSRPAASRACSPQHGRTEWQRIQNSALFLRESKGCISAENGGVNGIRLPTLARGIPGGKCLGGKSWVLSADWKAKEISHASGFEERDARTVT